MAHSHACTGLAAGAATLPLAPVHDLAGTLGWVAAWGGAALLPDFDRGGISWRRGLPRTTGSTVATMWGPVTTAAARVVGRIAGGHRWGTHDPVVGPAVFGAVAWAAALSPWTSLPLLAFVIAAALRACHVVIPGSLETTVVGNLLLSWGAAYAIVNHTVTDLGWLPWAVAGGVAVHIAGDWLTLGGVPRPLAVVLAGRRRGRRRISLRLFRTGHPVEHVVATAAGLAAGGLLGSTLGVW